MSITTKKMILTIGLIVWSFTLLRSLTIMIGGKKIFQLLGTDIFAVGQQDQIFLSAGDVQLAVFAEPAEIAGFEPAVLK